MTCVPECFVDISVLNPHVPDFPEGRRFVQLGGIILRLPHLLLFLLVRHLSKT